MPGPLAAAGISLGARILGGLFGGKKEKVAPRIIPLDALDPAIDPRIDETEYHRRLLSGIEMLRRKEQGEAYD